MGRSITQIIDEHNETIQELTSLAPEIDVVAERLVTCIEQEGTVFWMGNGGSAADSQHLAAEFVGRFRRERSAFASVALTTDTSILTAGGNDYGYDVIFQRQVEALCDPGDVVVGISTSGNSENVLRGIDAASCIGAHTVGLTGRDGGDLAGDVDECLKVPSEKTTRIQEAHILLGHILCEKVEKSITNRR